MVVNNMVEMISNGEKLTIKLGEHLGFASNFMEWIEKINNANAKKIKTECDRYPNPIYCEETYEITPLNSNAEIEIIIRDDNNNNEGYHYDYLYLKFNGKNWESIYKSNPNYH